jgi:rubrerythrin
MVSLIEKELLEILKEAIEKEREAQARYSKAASMTSLPEEKNLYLQLFQEELKHEKLLKMQYIEMKKRLGLKIMQEEIDYEKDLL